MSDHSYTEAAHDPTSDGSLPNQLVSEFVGDDKIEVGNLSGVGIAIGSGASVQIYGDVHYYPITLHAPLRQVFDQFIKDHTRLFGGRRAALDRIAATIQQPGGNVLVVTAPAGFGKTALLAMLVSQTPAAFAYHFFTSDPRVADGLSESFFLRNVVEQMAQWHGHTKPIPTDLNELRALFHQFLHQPLERTRLLVLDGLDEVSGWNLTPYLSHHLPDGLHLVLSVRDVGQDWRHDYWLPVGQISHLSLDGLQRDEVAAVLRAAGDAGTAIADAPLLLEQVMQAAAYENDLTRGADPFYLRLLAEDASVGLITPANVTQQPYGLDAYLDRWWQALLQYARDEKTRDQTRDLFGTLTAALGPIGRADLEAMNPSLVDDWNGDYFSAVLAQVRRFVLGDEERGYTLAHPRLKAFLCASTTTKQSRIKTEVYREKLLAHCAQWAVHASRYALAYYARHLAEAQCWDILGVLVTTFKVTDARTSQLWAAAKFKAEGNHAGYLADLDLLWRHAEEQHDMVIGLRCALIAASLRSLSGTLSPDLLVALADVGTTSGQWPIRTILEHIHQMPQPELRAQALHKCVESGIALTWHGIRPIIQTFSDERERADLLRMVISALPQDAASAVYHFIQGFADPLYVQTLEHLTPKLPPDLICHALVRIGEIEDSGLREKGIFFLAPYVPADCIPQALEVLRSTSGEQLAVIADMLVDRLSDEKRAQYANAIFLTAYATFKYGGLHVWVPSGTDEATMAVFLSQARRDVDEIWKVHRLCAVAVRSSPQRQLQVFEEVLAAIRAIGQDRYRAPQLEAVAPHLPHELLFAALDIAFAMRGHELSCGLSGLVPRLADDQLVEAFVRTHTLAEKSDRCEALLMLAPRLGRPALDELLALMDEPFAHASLWVVSVAHLLSSDEINHILEASLKWSVEQRLSVLMALAPYIRPETLARLLSVIPDRMTLRDDRPFFDLLFPWLKRTVDGESVRIINLVNIAAALPAEVQPAALASALAATDSIEDSDLRIFTLVALIEVLPPDLLDTALARARNHCDLARALLMLKLLGRVGEAWQPDMYTEAIASIQTIPNRQECAQMLIAALPFLPIDQRHAMCEQALTAAFTIGDRVQVADVLVTTAQHLSADTTREVHELALKVVRNLDDPRIRAILLTWLAAALPAAARSSLQASLLETIDTLSDPEGRAWLLLGLVDGVWDAGNQTFAGAVLEAINAVETPLARVQLLHEALVRFPPELRKRIAVALRETISSIADDGQRADVLCNTVSDMPPDQQHAALIDALGAAQQVADEIERVRLLYQIAIAMSTPDSYAVWKEALEGTAQLACEEQAAFLSEIAPKLPVTLHELALLLAARLSDPIPRLWGAPTFTRYEGSVPVQVAFAPYLEPACLNRLILEFLSLSSVHKRAEALCALALGLMPAPPPMLIREALASARAIPEDYIRIAVMHTLAPALPDTQRSAVLEELLPLIQTQLHPSTGMPLNLFTKTWQIHDGLRIFQFSMPAKLRYAYILTDWARMQSDQSALDAFAWSLEIAAHVGGGDERMHLLQHVGPYIPPALLEKAIVCAQTIDDSLWQVEVEAAEVHDQSFARELAVSKLTQRPAIIQALISRLPIDQQPDANARLLANIFAIPHEDARSTALQQLIPDLVATARAAPAQSLVCWQTALRTLASIPRPEMLRCLNDLLPWLQAVADEETVMRSATALFDIATCWS